MPIKNSYFNPYSPSPYLSLFFGLCLMANCNPPKPNTLLSEVVSPYQNQLQSNAYNVGFLIMDGVYNTELIAPWDIFHHTKFRAGIQPMNVFSIAKTLEPVYTFEGIKLSPDYSYRDPNRPNIDILVIPSAEHHLDSDMEDEEMIRFVRDVAQEARYLTSHCDGAFVLAKAGLLVNRQATTFPADIQQMQNMFPNTEVLDNVLFVHDGPFITSAGGAKSFEAALYLCEKLYGEAIAQDIAKGLVIDWKLKNVPHLVVK